MNKSSSLFLSNLKDLLMANVDILEVNKGMAILPIFQAYFHSFISNIFWHIK